MTILMVAMIPRSRFDNHIVVKTCTYTINVPTHNELFN